MGLHAFLQLLQQGIGGPFEKLDGMGHIAGIGFLVDQADTGTAAPLDLIEQTGAHAIAEDGILAGAQTKDLLQQLDGFLDSPGIGIRTEIAVSAIGGTTVIHHA